MSESEADTHPSDVPGMAAPNLERDPETERVHAKVISGLFGEDSRAPRIGRYPIVARLGHGAMGVVYACYDVELDRRVAVKVLRLGMESPSERARLLREALAMARLSHPHVAHVYEVGEHDGRIFVVMEFVEGQTLREWRYEAPRRWREVVNVYSQAGRGLAAAHSVGLIHRDFKPDNAILGRDGRVRVVDFGLARVSKTESSANATVATHADASRLTRAGSILGTPAYMAPEQFLCEEATASVDQFALCVALWEALHGEPPFAGSTPAELMESVTTGRLQEPPPSSRVPAWLRRVLLRGLALEATNRFSSMGALIVALTRGPSSRSQARRRRFAGPRVR